MSDTGYYCKECNAPASVNERGIIRTCNHTGTVIAGMSAMVTSHGKVVGGLAAAKDKLARLFNDLVKLFSDAKSSATRG